ncbi:MAG TPA: acetoacetate--CoA ligase [Kofleriaceae bacterium]|jgi:acetoacetyl-CoA synthetase
MTPSWEPDPAHAASSNLAAFGRLARDRFGVADGYAALHAWSIASPEQFWPLLWDSLGIVGDRGDRVLERSPSLADARFFPDARLSFAENLVRGTGGVIACGADGSRRELTCGELAGEVARVAGGLRALGVARGDRVAAAAPNGLEAIIAMLAANAIGAVGSLCDPELGETAVLDRFGQIEPALLLAPERRLASLRAKLPTVRHAIAIEDLASLGKPEPAFRFERMAFNDPAFILYTSGTTGLPKCIVHNTGGQLLQLLKEHVLHYDVRAGDRFFYQTSTGWNMWYWLVIALAAGATIVAREGSPLRPKSDALFVLADAERLTHLGVSPAYLAQLRAGGVKPREHHALAELRAIMSTGAPLSAALYDYVYAAIKADVHLISLSGGTEINACFVTGNPMAPVFRGEIQCAALGMATDVVDDAGASLAGAKGELVCRAAFPSQPVGFWNDPDRRRYLATYFERYPGMWHHGDFAELTANGGFIIHGRSDAVLKPSGHRIGTAEIYRQLESIDAIADAVAVGQSWHDDVRIVLFVVLRGDAALDGTLEREIRATISRNTTPYHVPARILAVADIPYTRTGKKAELAVRQIIHGEPVTNASALANPGALDGYRDLAALRR